MKAWISRKPQILHGSNPDNGYPSCHMNCTVTYISLLNKLYLQVTTLTAHPTRRSKAHEVSTGIKEPSVACEKSAKNMYQHMIRFSQEICLYAFNISVNVCLPDMDHVGSTTQHIEYGCTCINYCTKNEQR